MNHTLRDAIEHAPQACGPLAEHLRGWWTTEGYVCARCAGRLAGRGVALPTGSTPVWDDRDDPYGDCVCCSDTAREITDAERHNAAALRQHDTKADR